MSEVLKMKVTNESDRVVYVGVARIEPRESVEVSLEDPVDTVTLSDSSGVFFNVVLPTAYELRVTKSAKLTSTYAIVFDNDVVFERSSAGSYKRWVIVIVLALALAVLLCVKVV